MKKNILMFAAAAALCLAVSCQSEQKNQESQPVDALQTIAQRTSVRKYVQGKAVEQEKVDKYCVRQWLHPAEWIAGLGSLWW